MSEGERDYRMFSLGRIAALTMHTFTQMVRMRVFYFLLIFSVAVIAIAFVIPSFEAEQQLKILKDVSLGAMSLFSTLFAIAGTALLIPKDMEDRTLYTILSKPVPRYEYLLGKLFGMLTLILVSMLMMDGLFCGVLALRQKMLTQDKREFYDEMAVAIPEVWGTESKQAERNEAVESIARYGLKWDLQTAVWAIFLKAAVMTALTLAVSTFATSTLFTIISAIALYIIGLGQHIGREYFLGGEDVSGVMRALTGVFAVIFPDFHLFDIVDAVVTGEIVPASLVWKLTGITAMYLIVYSAIASLVFSNKEL